MLLVFVYDSSLISVVYISVSEKESSKLFTPEGDH
jgi:hypothetical protein